MTPHPAHPPRPPRSRRRTGVRRTAAELIARAVGLGASITLPIRGSTSLAISLASALAGLNCGRGGASEAGGPKEVPPVPFAFEITSAFEPPPGEGFWEPVDVAVASAPGDRADLSGGSSEFLWVVDRRANRLYRYDAAGRFAGTFGRAGGGPGELAGPLAAGFVGDTLWVYNAGNRRIDYFDAAGRPISTQPLPESAGSLLDIAAVGDDFVATSVFGPAPLVRFRRAAGTADMGPATVFGEELSALEARIRQRIGGVRVGGIVNGPGGAIPPVYRIETVGSRFWALHLYLPLLGIFEADGRLVRLVSYPSDPIEAGEERVSEEDGAVRRVRRGPPKPGGAIGALAGLRGEVYLLTHQSARGSNRQRLYVLSADGDLVGRVESGFDGWMAFAARRGKERYVIASRGEFEEPIVLRLRPKDNTP